MNGGQKQARDRKDAVRKAKGDRLWPSSPCKPVPLRKRRHQTFGTTRCVKWRAGGEISRGDHRQRESVETLLTPADRTRKSVHPSLPPPPLPSFQRLPIYLSTVPILPSLGRAMNWYTLERKHRHGEKRIPQITRFEVCQRSVPKLVNPVQSPFNSHGHNTGITHACSSFVLGSAIVPAQTYVPFSKNSSNPSGALAGSVAFLRRTCRARRTESRKDAATGTTRAEG